MLSGEIADFIAAHHVLGLATVDAEGLWAASCFYAADLAAGDLVILSAATTRHGAAMLADPQVAGTIAGQPEDVAEIEGVQFRARAECLEGPERDAALALYLARHPVARLAGRTEIWRLRLLSIKHTSNRVSFGRKTLWTRPAP
jgi:uncharacterized protein YhbP (UPF0306 family)